jgi:glycosyltransferase involved in cell wall biosynthesis
MVRCDKWKTGCEHCPQLRYYSFFFDRSRELYRKKKELFSGLDMTIVTPSRWLADLVKQSFLKDYPVTVINNGIDLTVFRPRESDFREKYGIPADKHILLGVAFDWGVRKGLDVFLRLAEELDPDRYQIVLVGTNDAVDKQLPSRIISIHRTQNQQELAGIYSAADLLLNPTREDTYPTVNMESLACGTPVLTFRTGGSPEMLDETCGAVVPCDDVEAFQKEILRICEEKPFSGEQCIRRARSFDQNVKFREYVELYEKLLSPEE